jgi:hypothetical protein
MAGFTALKSQGHFGWKSHYIISVEFGSSDISCIRFTGFRTEPRAKNDEESMVQLGRFLRISCHIGMPGAIPGLERYMETESLKE